MADTAEFGPAVAESTVPDDHPMGVDPRLYTDDGSEPASVWASSQRLREVIERQEARPPDADRRLLVDETQRQLITLGLFREVVRLFTGPIDPRSTVSLYVLLFPGEARDNTGTKDLNDKVLGYRLNSEYIAARQEEIRAIFPPPNDTTGPRYTTVGQDYRTASIIAVGRTPEDFAKDLTRLDGRLRVRLLEFLKRAEADKDVTAERLKEIRKLIRTLEKNQKYRFDFLFGTNTLSIRGKPLDVVFQLLTEALKGAGLARFAAKGKSMTTRVSKKMADRGIGSPAKGHDPRGRVFRSGVFLDVLKTADILKDLMTKGPTKEDGFDYRAVFVDTVWTVTFLLYKRVYFGNPDVIRDVRKKALVEPKFSQGVKFNFTAQKELLELWLVTLNMLDFIKDFVSTEYPRHVEAYHVEALLILEQLLRKDEVINWPRLSRFLTRDLRQRSETIAVQGTASEFQFYSFASDQPDQIFFAMDIRDLGVDLMAFYEVAQMTIQDDKLVGFDLMVETLRATDVITARRRFTYDSVVAAFRKHYEAASAAGTRARALTAFGGSMLTEGAMPDFRSSLRVMLGGDELFVAAHPYYAQVEHLIIADLAKARFQNRPLNMRAGVVYSSAARAPGPASVASGPNVSVAQRKENQKAHDRSLKLVVDSLNELKPLERTHRRIERLIEKLEANEKKKQLAPPYTRKLQELRLMEVYGRVKYRWARPLSAAAHRRLRTALLAGDLPAAVNTKLFELVDFAGNAVDAQKLVALAAQLEAAVRKDVGKDNFHVDLPPITKIPPLIQEIIDFFLPPEKKKGKDEDVRAA